MPAKKIDIHPELGPKQFVENEEEVLILVRASWPNAGQEGSTGPQRSWWTKIDGEYVLVGHSWPNRAGRYSVRVKKPN